MVRQACRTSSSLCRSVLAVLAVSLMSLAVAAPARGAETGDLQKLREEALALLYALQTFAGPGMPRGLQPDEEPVALSPAEQAGQMTRAINRVREREDLPSLEQSDALGTAATALLPEGQGETFRLNRSVELYEAVPDDQADDWRMLSVLAASCGGCGTQPTAADIRSFREQWLDDSQYAETLLDEELTHIGFVMRADGAGRKMAISVLGQHR